MAEQVQTGGLMKFRYGKGEQASLDPERKRAIEAGYAQAEERRRREKRNKIFYWAIAALIAAIVLLYVLLS